jgi:hypothetical protein
MYTLSPNASASPNRRNSEKALKTSVIRIKKPAGRTDCETAIWPNLAGTPPMMGDDTPETHPKWVGIGSKPGVQPRSIDSRSRAFRV